MVTDTDYETADAPAAPRGRLLGRAIGWVQADHLRRGPHLLAPTTAGLAAAAHALDLPAAYGIPITVLASIGMYTRAMNRPGDPGEPIRSAAATAAAGSWVTAAVEWGITAGPHGLMGWLGAAAYGLAYWAYRKDPEVLDALAWENARDEWYRKAPGYGLSGSHLLSWEETRLGEQYFLDTRGTGKRASALATRDLEERIAEQENLRPSRVKVRVGEIAGRLSVSIRYKNPWADPLPHPLLDPAPEIPLPNIADAREPSIIGMDPETARPLRVPLWDEDGAKRVLVVAITRGGKTVVVSNLMERATAADNVFSIGINVSKAKEMRRWAPALGLSACGPNERVKALRILELVHLIIDWRAAQDGDDATLTPRQGQPLIPVFVDEVDELLAQSDNLGMAIRREFGYLMSKGGSEGIAAVVAGQRGTVGHLGNGNIKRMFDQAVLLKASGEGEIRHVLGDIGLTMPNMMTYGEGNPGVALATDLAGHWSAGRSWFLKELPDIDRLVKDREPSPLEPGLVEFLGDKLTALTGASFSYTLQRPVSPPPSAETSMPVPVEHAPSDRAAEQRAAARATLNALPTITANPSLSAGEMRAAAIERRRQAAEQTQMSPEVRRTLLRLLAQPDGTTVRQAEAALETELGQERGVSKSGAWRCLDALRFEGIAELRGKGRGARWHLAPAPQEPPHEETSEGVPAVLVDVEDDHERAIELIEEEAVDALEEDPDDHKE
ncbi:hypothetical protein ACIBCT_21385 [Streptosporangium sp. NPDC050855]|uniref:hypothetical protein n=1 Tax=Streptosporangium sp. NPDC050855 TaxID=3366194 RepID=UPI00378D5002